MKIIYLLIISLFFFSCERVDEKELDVYVKRNDSLERAVRINSDTIEKLILQFDCLLMEDTTIRPYRDKAWAIKVRSEQVNKYIEQKKRSLIHEIVGDDSLTSLSTLKHKADVIIPTYYFLGDCKEEAIPGTIAFEFKEIIKKYNEDLSIYMYHSDMDKTYLGLNISDIYNPQKNANDKWEIAKFYNQPAVSVIAYLTFLKCETTRNEKELLVFLHQKAFKNLDR